MTRSLPLLASLGALLAAAPAQAATTTLSADRAVQRDCTARVLTGKAGVVTSRYTAPLEGTVNARLSGTGDWDLAAFDREGTLIAGSSAFRANELVEVNLRKGAVITLQACRVAGSSRTAKLRTSFGQFDFETLKTTGPVSLVEVPLAGKWTVPFLERIGLDVTHDIHDGKARVMLYGDADRTKLANTGLGFEIVQADVRAAERAFRARDRRAAARAGASPLPTGREQYRTFEDIQAELKDMVATHPGLVRPITFKTKTFLGRDIQAVEIATDVNGDDGRPVVFLNGIHHAREWPATEVIMEFAWDLLKNGGSDATLKKILRDVRVVVQPHTNVDGFIVSRGAPNLIDPESLENTVYSTATGVVLLGGALEYKRKNCNPYPAPAGPQPCEFSVGTDNNRNYPHTWGGGGASTNPNDQSFRGSGPGSEPETKAVQEFQLSRNAPVLISMHNIAAKVLRPPGTEAEGTAPDEEGLKELGRRMAEPAGYANEFGFQLYDVTGGTKDWAYSVTSAFGYTVETGPADGDFHGAYDKVVVKQYTGGTEGETAGRGMREALMAASLWTREESQVSRITGRAPAGRTLRIRKDITTLSSPVCSVAGIIPLSTTQATPDECVAPGEVIETPEKLDITTKVPASGNFEWWVNPSSRPYAKAPEAYTLTCEDGAGKVFETKQVIVGRGQVFNVDLPCGGTLPAGGGGKQGVIAPAKPLRAALGLPSTKKCVSKRAFDIRLRAPKGQQIKSATVKVAGKKVKVSKKGGRFVARVNLKGLKKSKFKVAVTVTTTQGRKASDNRTYRTCGKRKKR
jgi:hypothetical protein